jgi:hypothetical protein
VSAHETARDPGLPRRGAGGEPQLDDYENDEGNVIVFDPKRPLGWIEIDPDALVEVRQP